MNNRALTWLLGLAGIAVLSIPLLLFLSGGPQAPVAPEDPVAASGLPVQEPLATPDRQPPPRPAPPPRPKDPANTAKPAPSPVKASPSPAKPAARDTAPAAIPAPQPASGANTTTPPPAKPPHLETLSASTEPGTTALLKWRETHLGPGKDGTTGTVETGPGTKPGPGSRSSASLTEAMDPDGGSTVEGTTAAGRIPFSALFTDAKEVPAPGINIFYTTTNVPATMAAADGLDLRGQAGIQALTATDAKGRCAFELAPSETPVLILAFALDAAEPVFLGPVSAQTAWNNATIVLRKLSAGGATVTGRVLDRWKKPLKGAHITPLVSMSGGVVPTAFATSGADGTYSLRLAPSEGWVIACTLAGQEPASLQLPTLAEGQALSGQDFVLAGAGAAPASWSGRLLALDGTPLANLALSWQRFDNLATAVSTGPVFYTGNDGGFSLTGLEPGTTLPLFLYHPDLGVRLLEEHACKTGEAYAKDYTLDVSSDKPAELGFRLQTADGLDILEGWIASAPLRSPEEFQAHLAARGFGSLIATGGETRVKITPKTPLDMYYGNKLGASPVLLGHFELSSGEKRNVGLIRLGEEVPVPADISGMIQDQAGQPQKGLRLSAVYGSGEVASTATTGDAGDFRLGPLTQRRMLRLLASDAAGNQQVLKENVVLTASLAGEIYTWISNRPFAVLVRSGDKPVAGAKVSLTAAAEAQKTATTDADGQALFTGLKPDTAYGLSIFHAFHDLLETKDYRPPLAKGSDTFTLVKRKGVKMVLKGPDWEKGLHVRSFVCVARDRFILPDGMPGNEYEEVLKSGEILFLTPPNEPYWIYVGGMDEPWPDGFFGPYQGTDEVLEVELQQAAPLSIMVEAGDTKLPDVWSAEIDYVDKERGLSCPMVAGQFTKTYAVRYFLAKGSYRLSAEPPDMKAKEVDFEIKDRPEPIVLRFENAEKLYPAGGFVASYIVSDRFPLTISDTNVHLAWIYYGFNKDWLAHLGGEAAYDAVHLAESPNLDGTGLITWRQRTCPNDGILNFKGLWPGKTGDYSVAYAQFRVEYAGTEPKPILLGVSSDDGIKAWHNGQLVLFHHIPRPLMAAYDDQHHIPITLQPGRNRFNFKVDNSWGQWMLRVRLIDPSTKQPVTDLKMDPDVPCTAVATPPPPPAQPAAPAAPANP